MSEKEHKPKKPAADRTKRLAAALKANLRRRKAQARARLTGDRAAPAPHHGTEQVPDGKTPADGTRR